ncbi:band 4.1-like protein 2 isoform X1 [Xiphophorus maculatus]|uniref:band 4.1-like protein 2 isoform X1 n=2 Tax=Xiphophorus maculatus TaxID=8083 RepID=UPI000C6D8FD3|nr:band 4.1-like protein 2 isoform X1 [Xiphophorus maculatus]XP_023203690.1 band 4.1-like protein 2 isoform X1 [Xiphophorus maculatus]XP_023203691.1 band 4.1-like protein 2 isoform X1 [Xiphophorus maculatus]
MTTEAGSETEVKEKAEESPAQPDQSETAKEESQEIANVEGEEKEKGKEKEKEGKEGKGITRYLPTWFKKQKSQSQTSPTKEVPATEEPVSKGVEGEEEPAPEVNGHAEEVEEKEEVKSEEVKEATQPESNSNVSADTEPLAKEEKVEDTTSKSPEKTKETADGEGAEEEEKKKEPEGHVEAETDGGENQTSIFQSPLRLVRKNKMKVVVCHVTLLDGTDFTCEVEQKRAKGQYLFFKVCEHLNLLEKDYFGLMYKDNHDEKCWLDPTKEIKRQIRSNNWQFAFGVKFYPPDPSQLTEDITRYLLCLQLREDVASGRLPCSFVTHALLGSYTLQAELGDHEPDQPRPLDFISQLTFAPNQNKEMEEKILELHKSHRGMTPAQADLQFLENAKKLSMYGVDLHHAKDSEAVDIMLGVCANGLLVYKDRLRINRFAWPKILKISYKRNNFYIKIRPGETEQFESTVGFKLQNHRSAKRLWKVCVENHSFFRLNAPEPPTKARFLTLGSKFRYSGRTQAQTRLASSLIDRPAPSFERTSSKRISRSLDGAPVISITEAGSETAENGRDHRLELHSDSKAEEVDLSPADVEAMPSQQQSPGRAEPASSQDLDKTQDEVLKHQASISQLKRSFMEAPPPSPPQPNQWEKRLTSSPATIRVQQQQVVSVPQTEAASADNTSSETKEPAKTTEVEIEETVVIQEVSRAPKPVVVTVTADPPAASPTEHEPQDQKVKVEEEAVVVEEVSPAKPEKASSDSESEEEAEYHPNVPASISQSQIPEGKEEEEQMKEEEEEQKQASAPVVPSLPVEVSQPASAPVVPSLPVEVSQPAEEMSQEEEESKKEEMQVEEKKDDQEEKESGRETEDSTDDPMVTPEEEPEGLMLPEESAEAAPTEEPEQPKMNGEASLVEVDPRPQVICCSEPPVVKTEMVTISDTFAAQKTEIATKEVPIVHTETKTITYEAAQLDGNGDGEPGVLMTAQTITSESLCTTTTTHITKTLKGGLSETRIEKRIVITGDCDIDHDQALAQAIKEAKEQHPDMSVTRVVVHKETELAEEED